MSTINNTNTLQDLVKGVVFNSNKFTTPPPKKTKKFEIPSSSSIDKFVDELLNIEDKKKFYVAPKDFRAEYNLSIQLGEATNKLLDYFEKIAWGLSRKFPYANKQDQNTHVAYAVAEAWRKWREYNPEKTNSIFAFFTSMIRNDMSYNANRLNKHKHKNISIDSLYVNMSDM